MSNAISQQPENLEFKKKKTKASGRGKQEWSTRQKNTNSLPQPPNENTHQMKKQQQN
jgi:hypothetical protein